MEIEFRLKQLKDIAENTFTRCEIEIDDKKECLRITPHGKLWKVTILRGPYSWIVKYENGDRVPKHTRVSLDHYIKDNLSAL
ncbi:MAG: hypothetical protein ABH832_02930 [bacterium]